MIETSKHDTPINRASIAQFDINEAQQFIERIRERRFNAYKLYQLGLRAKEEKQHGKTMEALDKRLEQFSKTLQTLDNGINKLEKYALEIQGYMIAIGEYDIKKKAQLS